MSEKLIEVKTLTQIQNQRTLLDEISLQVHKGELVGIIGPNGAGKSTLLKSMIGYLPSELGVVELQGKHLNQLKPADRANLVSYLSQDSSDAFPFAVSEIVALGAYAKTHSIGNLNEAIDLVLEDLDIHHLKDRIYTQLSGGEKQLVQFARMLLQDAPLMLLDEPTANLDIGHEFHLMHCLRQQCDSGKSAMVAIHNLNTAAEFCDRVLLINKGKLVASGAPEKVITQEMIGSLYSTAAFVATNPHTGSVNVLPKRRSLATNGIKVHIIGGAGAAIQISKKLLRMGNEITGGIAHQHDSDAEFWAGAGIPFLQVRAFESIDETTFQEASSWIDQADITLLCDFPIGPANAKNLELASRSKNLVIIRSSDQQRRFYGDELQQQFDRLKSRAKMIDESDLVLEKLLLEQ